MKNYLSKSALLCAATVTIMILLSACGEKSPENVLVKVDDFVITLDDFKLEWIRQLPQPPGAPQETVDQFIEDMIAEKLFLLEASRRKIDQDEKLKREVEKYREQLMVETLLNQEVIAVGKPSQVEIEEYWQNNKDNFTVPPLTRFSHILVKRGPEVNDEEALSACLKIKERLDGGEDFSTVAREVSEGSSAARGGDLGYYRPDQISPEFKSAAEELRAGEISDPIKTDYGYHMIVVTDRKPARDKTLEESREEIVGIMLAGKRKAKFDAVKSKLESSATIWKNKELIDGLREEQRKVAAQSR